MNEDRPPNDSTDSSGRLIVKYSDRLMLISVALAVGLVAAILAGLAVLAWLLNWDGFWRGMGQPYATTLAALAAIIAGAIALHNSRSQLLELRTQRESEQERWENQRQEDRERWDVEKNRESIKDMRTRFAEATSQLAHESATVRRSGAYSMLTLSNDWRNFGQVSEAKVCIGVLTAYLNFPNPTYTHTQGQPSAGEDGGVRALIVALLAENSRAYYLELLGDSRIFDGADLRGVEFRQSMEGIDLSGADLTGASLRHLALARARFVGANLDGADFLNANLQDSDFTHASLSKADLFAANLHDAKLVFAKLPGADLERSNLEHANLRGADLSGADLTKTDLESTDLTGIEYDSETIWPDGFPPEH